MHYLVIHLLLNPSVCMAEMRPFKDHEERIPLFLKAGETDQELPYPPLIKYVSPLISLISI